MYVEHGAGGILNKRTAVAHVLHDPALAAASKQQIQAKNDQSTRTYPHRTKIDESMLALIGAGVKLNRTRVG